MSKRKRRGADQSDQPEQAVAGEQPASGERRLLPVDIQQKEFRLAFRGYNEHDVDEFLDQVTEELARLHEENKRLTERATEGGAGAYGGAAPGVLIEDAQRRAEEIVREARQQAASILSNAGSAPGDSPVGAGASAASGDVRSFLSREREFLQGLAGLIQQHAAAVKEDAQRARTAPAAAEATPRFRAGASDEPGPDLARSEPVVMPGDAEDSPFETPTSEAEDAWSPKPDRGDAWTTPTGAGVGQDDLADEVTPFQPSSSAYGESEPGRTQDTATWDVASKPWPEPEPEREPDPREAPGWVSPYAAEEEAITPEPPADMGRDAVSPSAPPGRDEARPSLPGVSSPTPAPAPSEPPAFHSAPAPAPAPAPRLSPAPTVTPEIPSPSSPQTPVQQPRLDDSVDPAEREEDDRSLRELFWGEE